MQPNLGAQTLALCCVADWSAKEVRRDQSVVGLGAALALLKRRDRAARLPLMCLQTLAWKCSFLGSAHVLCVWCVPSHRNTGER